MSYEFLKKFDDSGVAFYALPEHTSGKTQPLDVFSFAFFQVSLNYHAEKSVDAGTAEVLTIFDFCALLCAAFKTAMTADNTMPRFSRSGVWPLDPSRVIGVHFPESANELGRILTK